MNDAVAEHTYSSLLSLPLLCLGLAIVAACCLLPQVEANRKLTIERDKLKGDLAYVARQQATNQAFLKHIGGDPDLAERLAQRQMKVIRQGTSVLTLDGPRGPAGGDASMSPFMLVSVGAPPPVETYHAPPGLLGQLCRSPRRQLYLSGAGLLLIACGLVWGPSAQSRPALVD